MNTFAEVVEKVSGLSTEELEEIKQIVDKQLSDRRIDEIAKALTEAKNYPANSLTIQRVKI